MSSQLNQESNRVANAMQYAMKMELDGHDFYMEQSEKFANPTTKELFVDLAKEELAHYNFLKQEVSNYVENPDSYQVQLKEGEEENSLFKDRGEDLQIDTTLRESDVPDMTILRMAVLIEQDFAEFYETQAEKAQDPRVQEVFTMLSGWERGHEKMFRDEYNRLLKEYMSMPWGG